ncbi:hypothetical protein FQN53_004876 [Emmonsiellopsis sp. PD_33]|nr:hypothetical protein FQN53_004876 [Emmonsiellopsis sp. PD_33]
MSNDLGLPPRFEVRRLRLEHRRWAAAIVAHSNMSSAPIWPRAYPENITARCLQIFNNAEPLVTHRIESGMCFGVFDKEYNFKRPESAQTGGALYWAANDTTAPMDQLLEQMDFPLVSVAISYDYFTRFEVERPIQYVNALPLFPRLSAGVDAIKKFDTPAAAGEVLSRSSTCTRDDYTGHGIMTKLAHYLMREAASEGYREIIVDSSHDAVTRVWANPPSPFKGEKFCEVNVKDFEEEKGPDGKVFKFDHIDQLFTRIRVTLK